MADEIDLSCPDCEFGIEAPSNIEGVEHLLTCPDCDEPLEVDTDGETTAEGDRRIRADGGNSLGGTDRRPGTGIFARRPSNESELSPDDTLEHLECRHNSRVRHLYAEGIEHIGSESRYLDAGTESNGGDS